MPAGAPSRCSRVTVADEVRLAVDDAYRVTESGVGCTLARALARRWNISPACRALAPGGVCRVRGATCYAIAGSPSALLASARCVPVGEPNSFAELTALQGCPPPPGANAKLVYAWATNVDCSFASEFPINLMLEGSSFLSPPCGSVLPAHCSPIGGFDCSITDDVDVYRLGGGDRATCVSETNRHQAIEFVIGWAVWD
jgi:hypothetical protein